jgi:hypothetical protein
MIRVGVYSQNDAREFLDMNGIGPEGDTYYVALNMGPSEQTSKGDNASRAGKPGVDKNIRGEEGAESTFTGMPADASKRINQYKSAQSVVVNAAIRQILRKEVRAITRCAEKSESLDGFTAACAKFFLEHRGNVEESIRPSLLALAELVAQEVNASGYEETAKRVARTYTDDHVERSRAWALDWFTDRRFPLNEFKRCEGVCSPLLNELVLAVCARGGDEDSGR